MAAAVGSAGAWQELLHSSGRRYYFNAVTQERTWQRPPEMDGPAAGQPGPPATAVVAAAPVSPTPTTAAPTPAPQDVWVEGVSPQVCLLSAVHVCVLTCGVGTHTMLSGQYIEAAAQHEETPLFPPQGVKYYFNKVTKVSTWDRPAELDRPPPPPKPEAPAAPSVWRAGLAPGNLPSWPDKSIVWVGGVRVHR